MQLDRSKVKVLGELKYVFIRLASNSKVHQIIDILVADIPKAYGLLFNKDYFKKLNGYCATN